MALGIHTFYAYSISRTHSINNPEAFLVGRFVGDHYSDEAFGNLLKKVVSKLTKVYGYGGFTACWSPAVIKPYKPLTDLQKYKRAVTKAYNKHKKKVLEIINHNSLFVDHFLNEESKKLYARIDVLKKRYNQLD